MSMLLFLFCGVLQGVSGKAYVKVFPGIDRIIIQEPGSKTFTALNLKGERVADILIEGRPANVCEAGGYLFFSYGSDDGQVNLLRTDADLSRIRIAKNLSLHYPNTVNGKLYGLDIFKLAKEDRNFPRIAWVFDSKKMKYTGDRFFKLPDELIEYQMQEAYWLFSRGSTVIAVFTNSRFLYILNQAYLRAEAIESENIPSILTKIDVDIPGGFKNYGPYRPEKVLVAGKAKEEYIAWINGQTHIFLAWQSGDDIYLGYGVASEGVTGVASLDASYAFREIGEYPGVISGVNLNKVWMLIRGQDFVSIQAHDFP